MPDQKTTDPLKLQLIEFDIEWENKQANIQELNQILSTTSQVDIIVLPEMFTTGFSMDASKLAETMNGPTVRWMKGMSAEKQSAICGSLIIESEGSIFNRFVFATPEGELACYDKRHLFSFAGEDQSFTKGSERKLIEYRGWRIMPQICYDLRFPVWSRNDLQIDLLLYVANWPEMRIAAWDALLKARAIENLCYVAAVNRLGKDGNDLPYIGHSTIIGPDGFEIGNADTPHTISHQRLHDFRERFQFLKDKDDFIISSDNSKIS
jgi:predicted amidohydrolase